MDREEIKEKLRTSNTQYEMSYDIHPSGEVRRERIEGDIEYWWVGKDNGTYTLAIVYQLGDTDHWSYWIPTENQIFSLHYKIADLYQDIDEYNDEYRVGDNSTASLPTTVTGWM